MNAVNNEAINFHYMKASAAENEFNKLVNNQLQIENPDYTENKIKISEMKQNIIRGLAKVLILI